jgi:sugar lactone lactonase YvrE
MRSFSLKSLASISTLLTFTTMLALTTGTASAKKGKSVAATEHGARMTHSLRGDVMGGRQPIGLSTITLWEAGTTGPSTATQLANTTSTRGGNFIIASFACAHTASQLYLTATNGEATPEDIHNPNIALALMVGACNNLPARVVINELTTAATSYAMAQFGEPVNPSLSAKGAPGTTAYTGLNNAANLAIKIVNPSSGHPTAFLATSPNSPKLLNTIADIIVSCVNSLSPFTTCANLFATIKPPTGDAAPVNTWEAAIDIARSPGANVASVYDFVNQLPSGVSAPYVPFLTTAPNDLTLALSYPIPRSRSLSGLSLDSADNVWVSDDTANTIFEMNPAGTLLSPPGGFTAGGNLLSPGFVFYDGGRLWISISSNNQVKAMDGAGNVTFTSTAALAVPLGLAIDSFNNVWVANSLDGLGLTGFNPTSGFDFSTTDGGLSDCPFIAGDTTVSPNIMWVSNTTPTGLGIGTVVRVVNDGNPLHFTFSSVNLPTTFPQGPQGISVDNEGNVWVAISSGFVVKINNAVPPTIALGPLPVGGGLTNKALGVATDSNNNVWISTQDSIVELNTNGNALSPPTGFTAGGLYGGLGNGIAIDRGGNVWTVNNKAPSGLIQFVGSAGPVATPRVSGRPLAP